MHNTTLRTLDPIDILGLMNMNDATIYPLFSGLHLHTVESIQSSHIFVEMKPLMNMNEMNMSETRSFCQ